MANLSLEQDPDYQSFYFTLPRGVRDEHFKFLTSVYSIPFALYLIKKHGLEARPIDVADWCKSLGMDGPCDTGCFAFNFLNGVNDKDALGAEIDIKIPIIIVEHAWKEGRKTVSGGLVIDGNKRLRRAFLDGVKVIDGYVLPKKLALQAKER